MFTTKQIKGVLMQCDTGEIKCYICIGRHRCTKYATPRLNEEEDKK